MGEDGWVATTAARWQSKLGCSEWLAWAWACVLARRIELP
jgi:hypothetical protein